MNRACKLPALSRVVETINSVFAHCFDMSQEMYSSCRNRSRFVRDIKAHYGNSDKQRHGFRVD